MNDSDFASVGTGKIETRAETNSLFGFDVDFSRAKKLPNTGVTCDIYSYTYGAKHFLIKRIREEHRNKPVVWAAFEKEFEIGLNLTHQGLPIYRSRGKDFIVMDYVDGVTLSAMIRAKDPWLADPANIRQMLTQLVEVVDYLHQKNVVHCDIKCDNVMITAGTRNVVLIDLGGAYTFADHTNTGDPRAYGLDLKKDFGSPDIDFHGIGMIVDRLARAGFPVGKFGRFRRLCDKRGITPARLLDALKPRNYWPAVAIGLLAFAVLTIILILYLRAEEKEAVPAQPEMESPTVPPDTQPVTDTIVTVTAPQAPMPEPSTAPAVEHRPETNKPTSPEAMAATVRQVLPPAIELLTPHLDRLETLIGDENLTAAQLLEEERSFAELETETMSQAMRKLVARYPDAGLADIHQTFYGSDTYGTYIRRSNRVQESVSREVKRRLGAERQAN